MGISKIHAIFTSSNPTIASSSTILGTVQGLQQGHLASLCQGAQDTINQCLWQLPPCPLDGHFEEGSTGAECEMRPHL